MRARWLTGRAVGFHALAVVVVAVCLLAGRWQLHAALGGNSLSWAYTFEWPIFAVIAVVAWWHLIHEDPAERAARSERAASVGERQRLAEMGGAATTGAPPRSWQQATADAHDVVDLPTMAAKVEAAAQKEYLAHLAKQAARDEEITWRHSGGSA